jgi:uncharacterized protein YciI
MPERRQLMFYDYPSDLLERRGPLRAAHLQLIDEWKADGRILMAGAYGDPPVGGLFVFSADADPDAFADADPYVAGGLVLGRRVEPWLVV